MTDLADLFPGFASHWIDTSVGKIFARSGGSGPPLLCLHGYPQTNVMWHQVAPELARHFTLIMPDLPGYGWSAVPEAKADHAPYTKRAMAEVMIEIMEALGHAHFDLAGHDRGGRVAYRLALDHPGRLNRLATLDIVPTLVMWEPWTPSSRCARGTGPSWRSPRRCPSFCSARPPTNTSILLTAKWLAGNAKSVRCARHRPLPCLVHRSAAHPCELRGLSRRPIDRRRVRPGGPRCGPQDHRAHAGAVGRGRPTARSRSARGLAPMGDQRARNRHRLRPFPVRGSARRDRAGADRFLHRMS